MKECSICRHCYHENILVCSASDCTGQGKPLFRNPILTQPVINQRYELNKRLGSGGMGLVYRGRHLLLKSNHAIKIIFPDAVGRDETLPARFHQEAIAAAAIKHPNVVGVTDFGFIDDFAPFLVMELVEGRSLNALLLEEGRLSPARTLDLMEPIAAGVGAAHRNDILHRDLKPLNIMVSDNAPWNEGVKVVDFGLAKIRAPELLKSLSFIIANTKGPNGSPYYMSPEQWEDVELDARSDIYSLGVMLYQMLVGTVPFWGNSWPALMRQHIHELPSEDKLSQVGLSPTLIGVVCKALAKVPADRYQDTDSFITAVRQGVALQQQEAEAHQRATEKSARLRLQREQLRRQEKDAEQQREKAVKAARLGRAKAVAGANAPGGLGVVAEDVEVHRQEAQDAARRAIEARLAQSELDRRQATESKRQRDDGELLRQAAGQKQEAEDERRQQEEAEEKRRQAESERRQQQEAEEKRRQAESERRQQASEQKRARQQEEQRQREEQRQAEIAQEQEAEMLTAVAEEPPPTLRSEAVFPPLGETTLRRPAGVSPEHRVHNLRSELEERRRAEAEAARALVEEDSQLQRAEEARLQAEYELEQQLSYWQGQMDERREAEEQAAHQLEQEKTHRQAEYEALLHAQHDAVRVVEEQMAEELGRLRAEVEAAAQAEAEASHSRAQAETRQQNEQSARLQAEQHLEEQLEQLQAEVAARREAEEQEAHNLKEEMARLQVTFEARIKAQQEARLAAEQQIEQQLAQWQDENERRRQAEEEASQQREAEEARLAAEQETRRQAEQKLAEEAAQWEAEREARRLAEEQAARQLEQEMAYMKAEEERFRQAQLEALAEAERKAERELERWRVNLERQREAEEEAARRRAEEEEALATAQAARRQAEAALKPRPVASAASASLAVAASPAPATSAAAHTQKVTEMFQASWEENAPAKFNKLWLVALALLILLSILGLWRVFRPGPVAARQTAIAPASAPAQPKAPPAGMVAINGGTFEMGRDDVARNASEYPAHSVTVKSFFLGETEVTNAQYAEFLRAANYPAPPPPADSQERFWQNWQGATPPSGQEQWPVRNVSVADAVKFAEWRSQRDGLACRLPTEEEWEYAARGTDAKQLYPWGAAWQEGKANVKPFVPGDKQPGQPVAVRSYAQDRSAGGAFDLMGNVHEWTASKAAYYPASRKRVASQDRDSFVIRGGAYSVTQELTATSRLWHGGPETRHQTIGFRLLCEMP